MKKIIMNVCFLIVSVLLLSKAAVAVPVAGCGKGCNGQKGVGQQQAQAFDAETQKKYDKFMLETVDLRKELNEKQAEFEKLMASENPDSAKLAMLTKEYYQLRDFITEKAVKAGIVTKNRGCRGCNGKPGAACGLPASGKKVDKKK